MRAIIVDDESIMRRSFLRLSEGIEGLSVIGEFEFPEDAIEYAANNRFELAVLDISMPGMNGIDLAAALRKINPELLIVFVTAHEEYIRDANNIGADYYVMKPYKRETLEMVMSRMMLLQRRQDKNVFIQTFGRFTVFRDGKPLPFTGKAKEILALVVTKRGKEISNEELYSTIWENREYDNISMKVYYNALRRLKDALAENGLNELLISTSRGQMVNTDLFDCDYYAWQDNKMTDRDRFEGEFLTEYTWGEYLIGNILEKGN